MSVAVEKMRRLANQSREDTYNSNRDYQAIHDRRSQRFVPLVRGDCKLVFSAKIDADSQGRVCWGGYILSRVATTVTATLAVEGKEHAQKLKVEPNWRRFGGLISGATQATKAVLTLTWNGGAVPVELWGLSAGRPNIPKLQSGTPDLTLKWTPFFGPP
jgi:hypothetical protein